MSCSRSRGRTASEAFRPIALSHGSRLILERLGVFALLATTPIETIHVSHAGGFGRTLMRSEDHDLPALGYVTDGNELATVLGGGGRAAARIRASSSRGAPNPMRCGSTLRRTARPAK